MERADVLANRLKELRTGLGLDAPDLPVLPDDPLCTAFWIWKGDSPEQRRELLVGRLRYRIEQLEDDDERAALAVAYRLHPDYQQDTVDARRVRFAAASGCAKMTIQRREEKGIRRIATELVLDLADPVQFFGRKNTNVYIVFGRPMAKWRAWSVVLALTLMALAVGFFAGMAWFAYITTGYRGWFQ